MRCLLQTTLALATSAYAQPHLVRGVVVDQAGDPIPDVRIDHLAITNAFAKTDSSGHFEFDARGPSVVFRKVRWRSVLVPVTDFGELRIVLGSANDPAPMPVCPRDPPCVSTGSFCVPKVTGLETGVLAHGIDAAERRFTIGGLFKTTASMLHGSGPSWGGPQPDSRQIWNSAEFSEVQRDFRGSIVLDSRGKTPTGMLWRSLGQSGESISYHGVNEQQAALFDRAIDGLCVLVPDSQ